MNLSESFEIGAGVPDVLAALTDPAYHAERARRRGATAEVLAITGLPQVSARLRWELPTGDLDPLARRLVGERVVLLEEQSWQSSGDGATGTQRVSVEGLQVDAETAGRLEPVGDARCRCTLDGTLTARIPLLGRQVEKQAAPVVREFLRDEAAGLEAWTAAH